MSGRASAARYARALLDVAIRDADPAQVGRDLVAFSDLVDGNEPLREVLLNPVVPVAAKQRVVGELIARLALKAPLSKLLMMLAERDRFAILPDLTEIYSERLQDYQGVLRADVTTAVELPPERLEQLRQRLATATGRQVTMSTRVDPALIGGIVTKIGSTVYDGSVATRLEKMRARLLQQM
jgi:F-type H+-transporting ATPase subunit delta